MTSPASPLGSRNQADVPWRKLWSDVALVVAGVVVMVVSYVIDFRAGRVDWFPRGGAVAVLFSGVLAYRSLTKHYKKFYNDVTRGHPLRTSRNQRIVDSATLGLSALGTLVWAYGDKIFWH